MLTMSCSELNELEKLAVELRILILKMIEKSGSGHIGGSYSCLEILIALYKKIMKQDSKNANWQKRDRFILSKGHAESALYAVLYSEGYFPAKYTETMRKIGFPLQGHPSAKWLNGVDYSTGSLGQGLSFGVGQAICGKKQGFNVFVIVGDGELQEGQIWEAALTAPKFELNNLTVFVDCNKFQLESPTQVTGNIETLDRMWSSLGWDVVRVNGHDFMDIVNTCSKYQDRPRIILAATIKGKGVSFMENNNEYHGKGLSNKEIQLAFIELSKHYNELLRKD